MYRIFLGVLVWTVTSVHAMTLQEKVAQLFVVPIGEDFTEGQMQAVKDLVRQGIGGVLLKQGTVAGQRKLLKEIWELAQIRPLSLMDAEWGIAMRLRDVPPLPRQMTLGAVDDIELIYEVGVAIGKQCRSVFADLNLAPVADINSARNPIIGIRSFGDDPGQVSLRKEKLRLGIQQQGVGVGQKHFPGHGNVSVDPHQNLPLIRPFPIDHLNPFQEGLDSVDAIVSAHLAVPELTGEDNLPVTFSAEVIKGMLRTEWQFPGLIITDGLNMKALQGYTPREIALKALQAGHDLLLYGDHIAPAVDHILFVLVPEGMKAIEEAVESGLLSEEELNAHVERILAYKRQLKPVDDITPIDTTELTRKVFRRAITVLKGEELVPLPLGPVAVIAGKDAGHFAQFLSQREGVDCYTLSDTGWKEDLSRYSCIIAAVTRPEEERWLELLPTGIPLVAVLFTPPYAAADFAHVPGLVIAYEKTEPAQVAAAEILLGLYPSSGHLPVNVPPFERGSGICNQLTYYK